MTMRTLLISKLLKKYNIKPSKRLGQNFLIDESILNKIIEAADLSSNDIVLEIGPGLGVLTVELTKKVGKVIAIEKDEKLARILSNELRIMNIKNVEVIQDDILKIPDYQLPVTSYKLIANLPYYITSPVIRKFLETKQRPELMILMVQKEVAQRICAKPPRMNLLAISVQFYASSPHQKFGSGDGPKIISYVAKDSFYPQPKVDSAIIQIIPKETPKIDTEKFFNLVRAGFSSKRKMLKNNLPGIDFEKIGLNPKIRAENLSIDDWLKIYENL
ncbi:MAG: ribosomal RNA small subunit methyltransferase A [Candidatus Portnoybacteria bacterium RBG_13_40_8]|uniref:Ribosomal RNA small subunit methyltransferase A n=1 Tax=Candidatus Portnoybacteria bacterium RBG_13_40_8 TaxID=1801990 RepID=A0A1G2F3I9_9BACT|nr:MAG: ribosomal RNA small subunit methyltransferase A [Candidatus Portnoybacteria bacterium RBG_13_40_8]OGZ34844.1 MAG: ribosomal RNA small subunit methyltransferase A [Candidatus Portnoybacteria bacterium RIFCSPHIGHO2_01_FULL_39_19]